MGETRLRGVGAAPGIAIGRAQNLDRSLKAPPRQTTGTPEEERVMLQRAMGAALAELERLAADSEPDEAEMLAFQLAMLEDDELIKPILAVIAGGASGVQAWRTVLTVEAGSYADSSDAIFAARAADLNDIRDRVLRLLSPTAAPAAPDIAGSIVLVGSDLPLSRFLETDWSRGGAVALADGSPMGHVAMLARSRGIPMVVGIGDLPSGIDGRRVLVNGLDGTVVVEPSLKTRRLLSESRMESSGSATLIMARSTDIAVTADGTRISVMLNVNDVGDLGRMDPVRCDGIGLVRTELLFHGRNGLPSEDEQYTTYRHLLSWADGRPVVVRTLDVGGDKPSLDFGAHEASRSPLGLRGLRLSLREPVPFRLQLRALARAAAYGDLRVILPMVTIPEELAAAREILDTVMADLMDAKVSARRPALGMMVEVPASAIAIDQFDYADFFSIGSNDLTQYVMAAGREIGSVSGLADPLSTAVIRLIEGVARMGRKSRREVHLCGDAAADTRCIEAMLRAGIRSLSVDPNAVDRTIGAVMAAKTR